MGEWSDYFEDFPEAAPAPTSAGEVTQQKLNGSIEAMNADAFALIAKTRQRDFDARQEEKRLSLVEVADCPQCGLKALNVYKFDIQGFLCECQDCGIYGSGSSIILAIEKTAEALGDGLNW